MRLDAREIPRYVITFFLILWIVFTVFIFAWLIASSLKSTREVFEGVWALPSELRFENYARVLTDFGLLRYLLNSLLVVSLASLLVLVISAPIAYVLGRLRFRGGSTLSLSFIVGIGIPVQTIFIPLYLMLVRVALVDSLIGLTILYIMIQLPFTVYLLMGFFRTIPSTLEDSARIDGATAFQSFRQIMIPLARGGFVSAAIFNFVILWKEFLLALVFISSEGKQTISLGLYGLVTKLTYTGDWGGLFAGIVLVILPSVVFYILLARKFVAGITVGIGK